jgi:ABC-2 type transport system permease protein
VSTRTVTSPSLWTLVKLVAGREIGVRLRDKAFVFSTLFFLLFTAGSTVLPALIGGSPSTVAVISADVATPLQAAGLEVRTVADVPAAEALVRTGEVDAAVLPGDGPTGRKLVALDEAPNDVLTALSVAPPVQLLDASGVDPLLKHLVPLAFGMIFFLTSLTFGLQIAQSVTEEKQNRIVEILMAAVPTRALLAGKILGNGALALGQIVAVSAVALIGLTATGDDQLLSLLGPAIGWFIPFFLVGFLLLAALWAVVGALVSRVEDIASVSMPMQMLLILPFFAVAFLSDNPTVMTVLSYVPFSAPTAMPVRLFGGAAQPWEPVLALLVLLGAAYGVLLVAARLYDGALLRTSGRTSLRTAWQRQDVMA